MKKKKANIVGVIFLLFFIGPRIINAIFRVSEAKGLQGCYADFFIIKIPILLLITSIAFYFSCWVLKGVFRKFNKEHECLFTKNGTFWFMLGYEFIVQGMFWVYLPQEIGITYAFWMVSLIPVPLILIGALEDLDKYTEYSRYFRQRPGLKSMVPSMLMHSNLSTGFGLFIIWAVFAICTTVVGRGDVPANLGYIFTLFSFYLFMVLLLEVYALYNSPNSKIGFLLFFIFGLQLVLPLILLGVTENEIIALYSPFGYFVYIVGEYSTEVSRTIKLTVIGVNFLLCLVPIKLIAKKYRLILTTRRDM